ncbi:hypothetical protein F4777DRAFT_538535 [Nemania sp. FL0916]|nr:hypothetical protein F4777DRAFT_538535 [Nemania sp. FL0916]
MPTQTRSRGKPSATTTYRSTAAAPKQREFPNRRRTVRTYGRAKPKKKLDPDQETLTQMNFTSSAMRDFVNASDDDDDDEIEEAEAEKENMDLKPSTKTKAQAKSRSNRRKTTGDELDTETSLRQPKRRKTLGDLPNSTISSSFHTQTLTQMRDRNLDTWQIEDSEDDQDHGDDDDSNLVVETPRKGSTYHNKMEVQEGTESAVPSLIKSTTPTNRQKKIEIPSSQSPPTPMFERYGSAPENSPLMAKSTKSGAPTPILKVPRKTPRDAVIPDSYSTAHYSSPIPVEKSAVKETPSKRLRFDLPDDKENITPGRTKPKSPKPQTRRPGRQPLQEVPDSDEDIDEDEDETEYETEDEFGGVGDPESPTPKRFQHIAPLVDNSESELELELDASEIDDFPSEHIPEPNHDASIILGHESASALPTSSQGEEDLDLDPPQAARGPSTRNQEPDQDAHAEDDPTTPTPLQADQDVINLASVPPTRPNLEAASSPPAENDEEVEDLSVSQYYGYTQGLESQRLPLDSIRALGPQTPNSDIMVSLHPEHIGRIVDRTKNHEFRAWKIPEQVSRIWVYITRPESQLKYMCLFSEPKTPGQIEDEAGIGNVEFNQGKTAAKFAYEILQVYELNNPVSLDEMKRKGWVSGAPQKYLYIPPAVVGELTANLRCALFESQPESHLHLNVSESQELKTQLQNDADYSTQHYSDPTEEVIPASQSPPKSNKNTMSLNSDIVAIDREDFIRPALPRIRSALSNHGSPSLPEQRQRGSFVRPSQATTVSQASSSSPVISPSRKPGLPRPIPISSQSVGGGGDDSSPVALMRRTPSSLRSSQFQTRSQMLPESLLNDDIHEPPPIVWDSADEHSD